MGFWCILPGTLSLSIADPRPGGGSETMDRRQSAAAASIFVWLVLVSPAIHQPLAANDVKAAEDAVLLEESMDIDIRSPSEATVRYSNRTQVLTQRGVEMFESADVVINPWMTLKAFRGAAVAPDGK